MTRQQQTKLDLLRDALRCAEARLHDITLGIEWLRDFAPRCTDGAASRLADAMAERAAIERRVGEIRQAIAELTGAASKVKRAKSNDRSAAKAGRRTRQNAIP